MKAVKGMLVRTRFWIFLLSLGILAGGLYYYHVQVDFLRERHYREIASISLLKAAQIQQWCRERIEDAEVLSQSPFFQQAVARFVGVQSDPVLQADMQKRLKLVEKGHHYFAVFVCDTDGRALASGSQDMRSAFSPRKELLAQAGAENQVVLGDIFRGPDEDILLDVASPVAALEGDLQAFVILRSRLEENLYPLIQSWPVPTKTAESMLIRREGDQVLFLNELRHQAGAALVLKIPLTRLEAPAVQAALGRQGMWVGNDYRGVEVLADLRPVPDTPWFMVAKVDMAEILREAGYRGWVTFIFVALFTFLVFLTMAFQQRYRQTALYQAMFEAERERNKALETFRTTLYSIGDGVITTDTKGLVTRMNLVAEKLTGWSEQAAQGKSIDEIFHIVNEETRAVVKNPVHRVLAEGLVVNLANHTLLIARDGTERAIADSGAPIRTETGETIGVVLVFQDQTKQRTEQEMRRENEARLQAVLEGSRLGFWDWDIFTGEVRRNDIWAEMLGYKPEEVDSSLRQWSDLIHPDDRKKALEILNEYIIGQRPVYESEYRMRSKSGEYRWILDRAAIVSRYKEGRPLRMSGTHADITEIKLSQEMLQKAHDLLEERIQERTRSLILANEELEREIEDRIRAEEKIIKSKQMLQTVFDSISEPLQLLDVDMTVKMLNKAAWEYYTIPQFSGVLGKPCFVKYSGLKTFCVDCSIPEIVANGENVVFERRSRISPERVEQVTVFNISDEEGKPKGAVVRIRDITDMKAMQKALLRSEKLASIGVLASGIAHEINNPNNFITFNIPILKRYLSVILPIVAEYAAVRDGFQLFGMPFAEFEKDCFELVGNIENGSQRIKATVSELKDFSALRAEEKKELVNPRRVVYQAVNLARGEIKHAVKRFEVNVPENMPEVLIDSKALEQVIVNLLINAAQAADKPETWIRLDVEAAAAGDEEKELIIAIQDNGCGIEEKDLGKIFDPFFTTKPAGQGTGLGLYVCHNLMEGMGGRIEVRSTKGEGTEFKIRLKTEG